MDVFTTSKNQNIVMATPAIVGNFYGNLDGALGAAGGWGLRTPWGGAAVLSRVTSQPALVQMVTGMEAQGLSTAEILGAVISEFGAVLKETFEGLAVQGVPGPPGPPGPPGAILIGPTGIQGPSGENAFDDVDIPIPYDGWEGGFTDDSPAAGKVAWASFKIKYKGADYTVEAGNTANAYLYWDVASPTVLSSSNTRTDVMGVGKFLVGRNNEGTFEQSQFIKLMTAGFIDVNVLSALTADLGTCTAGTIVLNLGSTFRLKISPSGLQGSINSGETYFNIISQDGAGVLIQGDRIKAGSIETPQLADGSVTTRDLQTSASGSWAEEGTTIVTAEDFVFANGYIRLEAEIELMSVYATGVQNGTVVLRRGATTLKSQILMITNGSFRPFKFSYIDAPAPGSYDYNIRVSGSLDDGTYQNASLFVENLKK